MHYLPVEDTDDPNLPFLKELYLTAFPEQERRDWKQLLTMIGTVPEMQLEIITTADDKAIGFIISWLLAEWCYIEHLAIDPVNRGKKYGEKVMNDFMSKNKLLLEIEPPESADAIRRKIFYERLGMKVLPVAYRQPSYRNTAVSYEMLLMSNVREKDSSYFSLIISLIKQQVYEFF